MEEKSKLLEAVKQLSESDFMRSSSDDTLGITDREFTEQLGMSDEEFIEKMQATINLTPEEKSELK